MKNLSINMAVTMPALMVLAACNEPPDAPEGMDSEAMESGDAMIEQPVVEDPMEGDMVVEDNTAELSSPATDDGAAITDDQSEVTADADSSTSTE